MNLISLFFVFILMKFSHERVISQKSDEFDGILTPEILFKWGFTVQSTEMNLNDRNITSIKEDTFTPFINLNYLDLSKNKIEEINSGIMNGLESLIELNVGENIISYIDDFSFEEMINLKELSINENNLDYIEPNMFYGLSNLNKLYISKNRIIGIHSEMFHFMKNLQILDLESNKISFITRNEFRNLESLIGVNLKNNNLINLDLNIIQGCINLNKFCLFGNQFPQNYTFNYYGLTNLDQSAIWSNSCNLLI